MSKDAPKSLKEVLERRRHALFVGRERELDDFAANLVLPLDDDRRRFIFQVYGQGGIGKSSLLGKFQQLAGAAGYASARVNEDQRDVPNTLGRLGAQLNEYGRKFGDLLERHQKYRQALQELETAPDAPRGLPALVGGIVGRGGVTLGRRVPLAGAALDFVDPEAVGNQMGEWAAFVASKLTNKDEIRLMLDPAGVLTPLFLDGVKKVSESNPVMLLFDTFEDTSDALEPWILELIKGAYGDVPTSLIAAIAGRDRPSPNLWGELDELVTRIQLEPFTEDEAREYLLRKNITDSDVVSEIIMVSEGLPLLIATLASAEPGAAISLVEASGTAVERFLKWEDPERTRIALAAAVPRRLNGDVLAAVLEGDKVDDTFEWLKAVPFVSARDDGWVYHGVVRHQMLRYLRRESPATWTALHGRLAAYFEKLLAVTADVGESNDEGDALYHRLCGTPEQYVSEALGLFVLSTKKRRISRRRWVAVMLQAGEDTESRLLTRWGIRASEAVKAVDVGQNEPMVNLITEILAHPGLSEEHRAYAHARRGFGRALIGRSEDGLEDMDEAIRLGATTPAIFLTRAMICVGLGKTDDAIKSLEPVVTNPTSAADTEARFARGMLALLAGAPLGDTAYADMSQAMGDVVISMETAEDGAEDLSSLIPFLRPIVRNLLAANPSSTIAAPEGIKMIDRMLDSFFGGNHDARVATLRAIANITQSGLTRVKQIQAAGSNQTDAEQEAVIFEGSQVLDVVIASAGLPDASLSQANEWVATHAKTALSTQLGLELSYAGQYEQASDFFRVGLEASPHDPILLYNLAVAEVRHSGLERGEHAVAAAVAALTDLLEVGNSDAIVNYGLGGLEALRGHKDSALNYLIAARDADAAVLKWFQSDPAWTELRNDAEFQQFTR